MFKFGFQNSNNEQTEDELDCNTWFEAEEITYNNKFNIINKCSNKTLEISNIKLKYLSPTEVIERLQESNQNNQNDQNPCSVLQAEANHSDLLTAEYEGGLKIWECTSDLINYLYEQNITLKNKKVLDLGCGAGLLGIYALLQGSLVDFQDYNKEVIQYTTISNVILNLSENKLNLCKFYSGDWKSFININKTKYDYILTSETIYNPQNHQKLLDTFIQLLENNGTIYLAAKTYYFGVGGGIRQFENLINKYGMLKSIVCWRNYEGVQREILKITSIGMYLW